MPSRGRWLDRLLRGALRIASTKPGGVFFTTVQPPIDRFLLRVTQGRFSVAGIAIPTLLLSTRGRKSGKPRTAPLLYLPSEDDRTFYVIGSRGGRKAHAGWYYNLVHDPEVTITLRGQVLPYRATVLEDPERHQVWQHFVTFNRHFNRYQERIDRQIPVIRLQPR